MQSLSEELRETICRRVQKGSQDELLTIVAALTVDDEPIRVVPAPRPEYVETGYAARKATPSGARFELAELDHDLANPKVVIDRHSGLMWSRAEFVEKPVNWETADKTCRELRLAGFSDWRLPTVDELFALADRTRHEPAIDKSAFPECKSAWYWTATPYAPSPGDCAWFVSFGDGGADWDNRDGSGFVRAVRASQ